MPLSDFEYLRNDTKETQLQRDTNRNLQTHTHTHILLNSVMSNDLEQKLAKFSTTRSVAWALRQPRLPSF